MSETDAPVATTTNDAPIANDATAATAPTEEVVSKSQTGFVNYKNNEKIYLLYYKTIKMNIDRTTVDICYHIKIDMFNLEKNTYKFCEILPNEYTNADYLLKLINAIKSNTINDRVDIYGCSTTFREYLIKLAKDCEFNKIPILVELPEPEKSTLDIQHITKDNFTYCIFYPNELKNRYESRQECAVEIFDNYTEYYYYFNAECSFETFIKYITQNEVYEVVNNKFNAKDYFSTLKIKYTKSAIKKLKIEHENDTIYEKSCLNHDSIYYYKKSDILKIYANQAKFFSDPANLIYNDYPTPPLKKPIIAQFDAWDD